MALLRHLHRALVVLLAGCAAPAPFEPAPKTPRGEPPVAIAIEEPTETPPPSRTVPMRYETRRIGPTEGEQRHSWSGRPIDLDVKDADIHDVFRLLSDVGHANLVVADDVSGRVTVRMRRVPWDQALDVVARAKGLSIERDGSVFMITRAR
ncbi:MAG: secretin and TonB N-terminal domain-containing protein [Labilithrix sp.]